MWSCKISGKTFGQPISNIWVRLFLELKMNLVATSSATVRFIVRTRAARGSRASATLSMNVGSCARGCCFWHKFHISSIICVNMSSCSAEKDLCKDCSKLGGPEEDNSSQYYESCSYQSQANLENQIFAEFNCWGATLAVYWASLMAALPMETAILTIRT